MSTKTEQTLANMMVTSTGVAMCDSGGSSGRGWQIAQREVEKSGLSAVDHFLAQPTVDTSWYPYVSTFHYLRDRLEVVADGSPVSAMWAEHADDHLVGLWAFAEQMDSERGVLNTYNWENSLSDEFVFAQFHYEGKDYAVLSIHRGADIRSGYSDPELFEISLYNADVFAADMDVEIYIDWDNGESSASYTYGEWYTEDEISTEAQKMMDLLDDDQDPDVWRPAATVLGVAVTFEMMQSC